MTSVNSQKTQENSSAQDFTPVNSGPDLHQHFSSRAAHIPTAPGLLRKLLIQEQIPALTALEKEAKALGIPSYCMVCSKDIAEQEASYQAKVSYSFNDSAFLTHANKPARVCLDCGCSLFMNESSVQFSFCTVGHDPNHPERLVAYRIMAMNDFAAAVYKPLKAPYYMALKQATRQHTVWKARVNAFDAEESPYVCFLYGNRPMVCNPESVLTLLKKEEDLLGQLNAQKNDKKSDVFRLFKRQSLDLDDSRDFSPIDIDRIYPLVDETLRQRIRRFQAAVLQQSHGDRHLFSVMQILKSRDRSRSVDEIVQSLEPSVLDVKAVFKLAGDKPANLIEE